MSTTPSVIPLHADMPPHHDQDLTQLIADLRQCRLCAEAPDRGRALPHAPRPVFQLSGTARICIAGQAPGTRAHNSGIPFSDPSGDRLRQWMGVDNATFYDASRIAIVPMGLCFPGLDAHGSDRPPRQECARHWRARIMAALPAVELLLLVGGYAQRWHLPKAHLPDTLLHLGVNDSVAHWQAIYTASRQPRILVLPHPSWRNNAWIRRNPWFDAELLPTLRQHVQSLL